MTQVLNIFRKDTRRFWLEISISAVLMFAFAVVDANDWKVFRDPGMRDRIGFFIGLLALLMGTSWWLLIARVVHAETLVGDRQFWITRPYEWKKLLAAKALFAAVWLGVPYLLSQSLLLAEAGFNPLAYLPGLVFIVLLAGMLIFLPVWSMAAVTSTFARLVMTTLGCLVLIYAFLWFQGSGRPAPSNPYTNQASYPLLLAGCGVAIALQYATRRTWITRGVLIALPILLAGSGWAYSRPSLVDKAYPWPQAGTSAPVSISFSRATSGAMIVPTAEDPVQTRSWAGQDYMVLPLKFSDVANGYAVFTDDFRFTFTAANGAAWTSPWQVTRDRIVPGVHQPRIELIIPPDVYDRFKTGPVTLGIEFALSRYQAGMVTHTTFPAGDAAVPGIGFCQAQRWGVTALQCRSAISMPQPTYIAATWWKGACEDGAPQGDAVHEGYSWLDPPAGLNLSLLSVRTPFMWFRSSGSEDEPPKGWHICAGTPLTLTQYHLVDRTRAELTVPGFVLPAKVRATD